LVRLAAKVTGPTRVTFVEGFCPGIEGEDMYEGHRWAVTEAADPLIPLAYSATGIEAVRHKDKPILGLQFHPEMMGDGSPGRLIVDYILQNRFTPKLLKLSHNT